MKERNYSKAMKSRKDRKHHSKKKEKQEEIHLVKYQKEDLTIENDTIVGVFKNSRSFGFVIPDNKKVIGTDIFISKKDFGKAKNNQKVVVQITKMPTKDRKAEGKIIEVLGKVNQAGIDMMSLIREYDLPYEFPEMVKYEAEKMESKVTTNEMKNRLDLRRRRNIYD